MADFGFLSDTDEELSAVEELISQTKDLCVLEQVSKINCSGFTDSNLPSDLETRFRKLKSFPVSKPKNTIEFNNINKSMKGDEREDFNDSVSGKGDSFKRDKRNPDGKLDSSYSLVDQVEDLEKKMCLKSNSKLKSKSGSLDSPTSPICFDVSFMGSPSPPRRNGCFWCSPKKVSKEKSKDLLLSDLGTFSVKEQEKILRKSMKEEEKISWEAKKIVKWAKQASARMSSFGMEDELSIDDDGGNYERRK